MFNLNRKGFKNPPTSPNAITTQMRNRIRNRLACRDKIDFNNQMLNRRSIVIDTASLFDNELNIREKQPMHVRMKDAYSASDVTLYEFPCMVYTVVCLDSNYDILEDDEIVTDEISLYTEMSNIEGRRDKRQYNYNHLLGFNHLNEYDLEESTYHHLFNNNDNENKYHEYPVGVCTDSPSFGSNTILGYFFQPISISLYKEGWVMIKEDKFFGIDNGVINTALTYDQYL